jgi:hypothetical protein
MRFVIVTIVALVAWYLGGKDTAEWFGGNFLYSLTWSWVERLTGIREADVLSAITRQGVRLIPPLIIVVISAGLFGLWGPAYRTAHKLYAGTPSQPVAQPTVVAPVPIPVAAAPAPDAVGPQSEAQQAPSSVSPKPTVHHKTKPKPAAVVATAAPPTQETEDERNQVVYKLIDVYLTSHPRPEGGVANDEFIQWVNARLAEMGKTWTVEKSPPEPPLPTGELLRRIELARSISAEIRLSMRPPMHPSDPAQIPLINERLRAQGESWHITPNNAEAILFSDVINGAVVGHASPGSTGVVVNGTGGAVINGVEMHGTSGMTGVVTNSPATPIISNVKVFEDGGIPTQQSLPAPATPPPTAQPGQ